MNQKTTTKGIAAEFLQQGETFAKLGAVRELEETDKGNYIAFVDDGADSFDVAVQIDSKGVLVKHSCDCKEVYKYCGHVTAVIYSIYNSEQLAPKKAAKQKKQKPSTILLHSLSNASLIQFLEDSFAKDKAFEQAFIAKFEEAKVLSYIQLGKLLDDTRKLVVKNRKKIIKVELQKMLELIDLPIERFLGTIPTRTSQSEMLEITSFMGELGIFLNSFEVTTNLKLKYYKEKSGIAANLIIRDSYQKWLDVFMSNFYDDRYYNRPVINMVLSMLECHENDANQNVADYIFANIDGKDLVFQCSPFAIAIVSFANDMHKLNYLKPIDMEVKYNLRVIESFKILEAYDSAIAFCKYAQEINTFPDHDRVYSFQLRELYKTTNDQLSLTELIKEEHPAYLDVEDYKLMHSALPESEFKVFRNKVMPAMSRASDNKIVEGNYFEILLYSKKYEALFEKFRYGSLYNILKVAEHLVEVDSKKFLVAIASKTIYRSFYSQKSLEKYDDSHNFEAIIEFMKKHYSDDELLNAYSKFASQYSALGRYLLEYLRNQ